MIKSKIRYLKKLFAILCISLLIIPVLTACNNISDKEVESEQEATPVEVGKVAKGQLALTRDFSGRLTAENDLMVISKMPAKVTRIHVNTGDNVKKGDLLIELCLNDLNPSIKQAQASYDASKTSISEAKSKRGQLEEKKKEVQDSISNIDNELKKNGFVTTQEGESTVDYIMDNYDKFDIDVIRMSIDRLLLNNTKQQLEQALAALPSDRVLDNQMKQAQLGVDTVASRIEDYKIFSPIDGIVSAINVEEGEMAVQTIPPINIISTSNLILGIGVGEYEINRIKKGDTVSVIIDSVDKKDFKGEIESIAPSVDPRTKRYTVNIKINNNDLSLKPGMFAKAKIITEQRDDAILIPKGSILREKDKVYVFMIMDGKAQKRYIKPGLDDGNNIEVLSGLELKDSIVIKGQDYLQENYRVKVVKGETQ